MGHTKPFSFPLQRELSVKERVQQQSHRSKDLEKLCYPQAQVQWSFSSVHLRASTPVKLVLKTWVCCRTERLQCEKTQQLYAGEGEWITGLERERKPRRAAVDSHINQLNLLSPSQITELSILILNSFQMLHCRFSLSNSVVSEASLLCMPPQTYFAKM